MFEGAILPAHVQSGTVLRPLNWGELVARFSAARDLRELVSRPLEGGSSFAARAAKGLPHDPGEPPVNLGALEPMKPLATIDAGTMQNGAEGDQGRQ